MEYETKSVLQQKIQAHQTNGILKDVALGLELLQHLVNTPTQTYYPHGFAGGSSERFDRAEALTHALMLCVSHNDLELFDTVLQWGCENKVDCGIILEKYTAQVAQSLARHNEKDRLEKFYDLYFPEKDLNKLQRFRFSMGKGVSPEVLKAILCASIEEKSWEVLRWVTPLTYDYHKIAPQITQSGPYYMLSWEMAYNYLPDPQYDDVFEWWLTCAQPEDVEYTVRYARSGCNLRRMEMAIKHVTNAQLEDLQQAANTSKVYLQFAVENEISRRQHATISAQLEPVERASVARKI